VQKWGWPRRRNPPGDVVWFEPGESIAWCQLHCRDVAYRRPGSSHGKVVDWMEKSAMSSTTAKKLTKGAVVYAEWSQPGREPPHGSLPSGAWIQPEAPRSSGTRFGLLLRSELERHDRFRFKGITLFVRARTRRSPPCSCRWHRGAPTPPQSRSSDIVIIYRCAV